MERKGQKQSQNRSYRAFRLPSGNAVCDMLEAAHFLADEFESTIDSDAKVSVGCHTLHSAASTVQICAGTARMVR